MATSIAWAEQRAAVIMTELRAEYSRGWSKLSQAQRNAILAEQVHHLLQAQDLDAFKPAQALCATVLSKLGVVSATPDADFEQDWAMERAKHIAKTLRQEYGAGWEYLSQAQQDALRTEQVLNLLLSQLVVAMEPARQLVRVMLSVLAEKA